MSVCVLFVDIESVQSIDPSGKVVSTATFFGYIFLSKPYKEKLEGKKMEGRKKDGEKLLLLNRFRWKKENTEEIK